MTTLMTPRPQIGARLATLPEKALLFVAFEKRTRVKDTFDEKYELTTHRPPRTKTCHCSFFIEIRF